MLIQINSGKGPMECEYAVYLYANALLKEIKDLKVITYNSKQKNTYQSIVLQSNSDLSYLQGSVKWICESPFRKHHKRKIWFIDVSIMKEEKLLNNVGEIKYEMIHSRGKGGQHVNKSSTAIRAIHVDSGISVMCDEERSMILNKKVAYYKLICKLQNELKQNNRQIEYDNWNAHNLIVRGNPYRIYKGLNFELVKN